MNPRGYLVDQEGNVLNNYGKVMFKRNQLSSDLEIPKIFPFMKFNVESVQGIFERDPGGDPMLERDG